MQLMRTVVGACALVALTIIVTGSANAQMPAEKGPFRVRIGGYLPSNGHTKEALGTNFLSVGAGYDLRRYDSFLPMTVEAYVDYFNQIKHHSDETFGRIQASVLGGGLLAKYSLDPQKTMKSYHPYAGVGLGIYWAHIKQDTVVSSTDLRPISQSTNRTTLGGKALLGAELASGVFGELEYSFAPRPSVFGDKVNLSGAQLRVGYHF